jgi:hypothetical protein
MSTAADPEFEATARVAFVAVYGEAGIDQLAELVQATGESYVGMAIWDLGNRLNLSSNDRRIFRAVADQLLAEMEQPA